MHKIYALSENMRYEKNIDSTCTTCIISTLLLNNKLLC